MKAQVFVTLRKEVLDPQGKAVANARRGSWCDEGGDVRGGKYMEVAIDAKDRKVAGERVRSMCQKLLANPVIEDFRFELEEGEG